MSHRSLNVHRPIQTLSTSQIPPSSGGPRPPDPLTFMPTGNQTPRFTFPHAAADASQRFQPPILLREPAAWGDGRADSRAQNHRCLAEQRDPCDAKAAAAQARWWVARGQ